jgi:hypothetical protein
MEDTILWKDARNLIRSYHWILPLRIIKNKLEITWKMWGSLNLWQPMVHQISFMTIKTISKPPCARFPRCEVYKGAAKSRPRAWDSTPSFWPCASGGVCQMPKHFRATYFGGYMRYGRQRSANWMQIGGHLYRLFQGFATFFYVKWDN